MLWLRAYLQRHYYARLVVAIGLKVVAASYLIGVSWLLYAMMHYVGVPWYFCAIVIAVWLPCEFDWNKSLPCAILRAPFPKRLD